MNKGHGGFEGNAVSLRPIIWVLKVGESSIFQSPKDLKLLSNGDLLNRPENISALLKNKQKKNIIQ